MPKGNVKTVENTPLVARISDVESEIEFQNWVTETCTNSDFVKTPIDDVREHITGSHDSDPKNQHKEDTEENQISMNHNKMECKKRFQRCNYLLGTYGEFAPTLLKHQMA